MKMFALSGILAIALAANTISAHSYPEAKLSVKVIDEEAKPVPGASVGVGFQVMSSKYFGNEELNVRGVSSVEGEFSASAKGDRNVGFTVKKPGYYQTTGKYNFKEAIDGKWQPWNPTLEVALRKIGTPVPMYAKKVELAIPAFGIPVGFDFIIGDWVTPHGAGKNRDLVFTAHLRQRSSKDYDYELFVTFPNPGDGIQPFEAQHFFGSEFKSPRLAPIDGYLSEWKQFRKRKPGAAETSNLNESRNYLLRVRTVLDENGKLKSALYGKIYGDFLRFTYYLNPNMNDRNLEFDPTRNLSQGLTEFEHVKEP